MTPRLLPGFSLLLLAVHALAAPAPEAPVATFESGVDRVALVELYTSEGCSSCPPADRWLSRLKSDPRLWRDFVPLAFHVDYWDYIGWQDRFARPAFSQRQRTPGFLKDGSEWRGWFRKDSPAADTTPVGVLSVGLEHDRASIRFDPRSGEYDQLDVNVAVLGMGLTSDVTTGENGGKTLHHDFVVLDLVSRPLLRTDDVYTGDVTLDDTVAEGGRRALAVWVSERGRLTPIQAVGGFL